MCEGRCLSVRVRRVARLVSRVARSEDQQPAAPEVLGEHQPQFGRLRRDRRADQLAETHVVGPRVLHELEFAIRLFCILCYAPSE